MLLQEIILALKDIRKLPWYEDGFLKDPCNARDMRNEQYAVLSHYLDNLINGIQVLSPSNMEVFNASNGKTYKNLNLLVMLKVQGAEFSRLDSSKS